MTTNILANLKSNGSAAAFPASSQPAEAYNCQPLSPKEFAQKIGLPVSWIYDHLRQRSKDKIPHLRFGKYRKIEWNCPDVIKWIERHRYSSR